jgi:hypothetical protein
LALLISRTFDKSAVSMFRTTGWKVLMIVL